MQRFTFVLLAGGIFSAIGTAEAQSDTRVERAKFAAEISMLLAGHDSFVAIEHIESGDDAKAIARRYFYLVMDLYSQKKVDEMCIIGRIGMHYLLNQSRLHSGEDEEAAVWFKSLAQMTSFNLASNLWPGWGDEGISITDEQQAFGADMAQLDLRLVKEMELPENKLSTATWVIGIHDIAAGRYEEGKAALRKARKHAEAGGSKESMLMIEGYLAIAEILEGKNPKEGRLRLAETKQSLEKIGTEDAKFFAKQHADVLRVLSRRS